MERFKQIHPGFDGTRELKLIQVVPLTSTVSQDFLPSLASSPSLSEGPGDKAIISSHVTDHDILFCLSLQDLLQAHEEEDTDKFADIVCNPLHT